MKTIEKKQISDTQDAIESIVSKIVFLVNPIKVVLFGSSVRLQMNKESDIDLLIVMPNGTHKRKTAQFLYSHVIGFKLPFDIIVTTPDDLERHKNNIGLVYRQALTEGKEVYCV